MFFRDAAAIRLESRKADTRNNAANHRAEFRVAEAAARLILDWTQPLHPTFYKAVYRPVVLRANRLTPRPRS